MIKKIICTGAAFIICVVLFSACGSSSGIWYHVGYGKEGTLGYFVEGKQYKHDLLTIAYSLEELKALCEERNSPAFQQDSEYYALEPAHKIREYDDAFFDEKALVIVSSLTAGVPVSIRVRSVKVEETRLIINAHYSYEGDYGGCWPFFYTMNIKTVAIYWLFLIEVNQADIADVTDIQIEKTGR